MSINGDGRKGGRGQCSFCGQWDGNIAFHEAWECKLNPVSMAGSSYPTEQLNKLKETVKEINRADQSLNDAMNDAAANFAASLLGIGKEDSHECTYDADGAACPKCGKTAIEHSPLQTDVTKPIVTQKGLQIHCDTCLKLLTKPGALVFSPPSEGTPMNVTKHHICIECYELLANVMGLSYNFSRKQIVTSIEEILPQAQADTIKKI